MSVPSNVHRGGWAPVPGIVIVVDCCHNIVAHGGVCFFEFRDAVLRDTLSRLNAPSRGRIPVSDHRLCCNMPGVALLPRLS